MGHCTQRAGLQCRQFNGGRLSAGPHLSPFSGWQQKSKKVANRLCNRAIRFTAPRFARFTLLRPTFICCVLFCHRESTTSCIMHCRVDRSERCVCSKC
jgi:hypothetical protein